MICLVWAASRKRRLRTQLKKLRTTFQKQSMSFIGLRQLSSPLTYIAARLGALLTAALLIGLAWYTVPLAPQVDPSFFFGDDDPQLKEDAKLYKLFPRQAQIIINIEGKISSADYLNKIDRLTRRLQAIPQVVSAKSLTHGPKSLDDALKSSFWGRLLIPEDRKSSNIFVALVADS